MVIVVVSDQHLGYEMNGKKISNDDLFHEFLDYVISRDDVKTFVVLGDFIDMWRRDVSGLFLEYQKITNQLINISDKIGFKNLIFVVGNHDYHLLKLNGKDYHPFSFQEEWFTSVGRLRFAFKHGWEFDFVQNPIIMEDLCRTFSDQTGQERSAIYYFFSHFTWYIKNLFGKNGGGINPIKHIMLPPEKRHKIDIKSVLDSSKYPTHIIESNFNFVERKAFDYARQFDKLIFGHTHRPFVSKDGKVANSGSWVSDAVFYNTFLEIDENGEIEMFQYQGGKNKRPVGERVSPPTDTIL